MIPDPLRVLCIGDNRPGHEKQTQAMLDAFGKRAPVEFRWFRVPDGRRFASVSRLQALVAEILPVSADGILESWGWNTKAFHPHLVMATGSHTHGALLVLGRYYRARTLVCMTPDFFVRKTVDRILSPMHDGKEEDSRLRVTLGPPCRQIVRDKRCLDRGLILVGGTDASSHVWDTGQLMKAIGDVLNQSPMDSWEIGSSPRTPEETERVLAEYARERPDVSFQPFSVAPRGWVEQAYARSTEVWISADSISMVYEALTAGCRVGILPVQWRKRKNKFQKSLDFLHAKGWVVYPGEMFKEDMPLLDEAGRAAEEAVTEWWGKK
ncbi:mitochondrial fission ELM1 family protein [Desulfobotulus sp. H1]|uniref:Mitochondrial fission ELM1 family protein n=1 Tax=Desulfobotulus pelophilus TaxID=2823377 RepID=A0ABT3N9I3_9BACT|nr:ELM1/GtrOC1 family putative glycosyltransferase [Desulfobotulus pelophilus]MCW7754095.1 mitochondrial fission ELM1 family protein [Desulfobotulus pelophilus]